MDPKLLCMGCMAEKGDVEQCPFCGWAQEIIPGVVQHLLPGTILQDKYLLGKVLGHGGFGVTYLAWDLTLNIKLAIKEYLPREWALRSPESTEVSFFTTDSRNMFYDGLGKFLDEARTLAQFMDNPNIVSVRDFFKANGTAYLVMSYVDGINLKQYLANNNSILPYAEAVEIMIPIMNALEALHKVGIIHRDVSPENIFISSTGVVKLLDFGAARYLQQDKDQSLSVVLKRGYAPLEQYSSRGKQGPWTDVYALAVTLYRMITGELPVEAVNRKQKETLSWPSNLDIYIPVYSEAAIIKAMALEPEDRFQNMRNFRMAFLGQSFSGDEREKSHSGGLQAVVNQFGLIKGAVSKKRGSIRNTGKEAALTPNAISVAVDAENVLVSSEHNDRLEFADNEETELLGFKEPATDKDKANEAVSESELNSAALVHPQEQEIVLDDNIDNDTEADYLLEAEKVESTLPTDIVSGKNKPSDIKNTFTHTLRPVIIWPVLALVLVSLFVVGYFANHNSKLKERAVQPVAGSVKQETREAPPVNQASDNSTTVTNDTVTPGVIDSVEPEKDNLVKVASINLQPDSVSLTVGDSGVSISARVLPANANQRISWTSSNARVARVNKNGTVYPVGSGTARIIATAEGGISASCGVQVQAPASIAEKNQPTIQSNTGTISWNGGTYTGEIQNGIPNGRGRFSAANIGLTYEGGFSNGKYQGWGILTSPGQKYVGDFSKGLFHGNGVLTKNDNTIQKGRWEYGNYVGG